MTINVRDASAILASIGFQLDCWCRIGAPSFFHRRVADTGLYHLIEINRRGRGRDTVGATVYCSLTRGQLYSRGLFERTPVAGLGPLTRGYEAVIRSREDSLEFLRRLAALAPDALTELTSTEAAKLIESTAITRTAVDVYAKRVKAMGRRDEWMKVLQGRASSGTREDALRLAHAVGVVRVRSGAFMFEDACLAMCLFEDEVEGTDRLHTAVPLEDLPTMQRIILLVQNLYGEDGEFWAPFRTDC